MTIQTPPSEAEGCPVAWAGASWCSDEEAAWHERDRRYKAALARVQAATPTTCPLCGGRDLVPFSFEVGDRRWECLDRACCAVFDAPEVGP